MHIKKLEIFGFKSFRNKTVLEFSAGPGCVTGIVGPNGCGKSNIVDAIIWVMGESAPKRLRGGAAADVIFSGSGREQPSPAAEVSMTLAKGASGFPETYKNLSELMITRRAGRDGKTECLINGQSALLRDIKEIFMNTGAGCRGFSVIEQEAIEKLISARPCERRFLIEEAAGVTKFKARKEESLRKLELARQNTRRIDDILKIQQRRLDSLSAQARQAEKYRQLKQDIKSREIELICRLFERLSGEQKEIREAEELQKRQKRDLESEILRCQNLLKGAEKEIQKAASRLETEKAYLSELSGKILERKKEIEKREGNIEIHTESLEGQEDLQKAAQAKVDSWTRSLTEISESKKKLQQRERALRRELSGLEAFFKEGWNEAEITRQRDGLERQIKKLQESLREKSARIQAAESQIHMLERERERLLAGRKERERQLKKTLRSKARAMAALEKSRQMNFSFQKESADLEAGEKALEGSVRALEKQLSDWDRQIVILEYSLSGQQKLISQFMGMKEGASQLLAWRPEEFKPLFQSLQVEPGFEAALAAALGRRFQQALIPADKGSIERGIKRLKESQSGRAGFLSSLPAESRPAIPASELKKYPAFICWLNEKIRFTIETEALKPLTSQTAVVSDLPSAFEMKLRLPSLQFVTKDGDIITREAMVFGGSAEKEINLFQIKNKISSGRRDLRAARTERELKKSEWEQALRQLKALKKASAMARARSLKSSESLALQAKDSEQLKKDILRLTGEKSLIQKRHEDLEREKSSLLQQKSALRKSLRGLETSARDLSDSLGALQRQEANLRIKAREKSNMEMEIFKSLKEQQNLDQKSRLLFSLIEQSRPETEKAGEGKKALMEKIQREKALISEIQKEKALFLEEKDQIEASLAALQKEGEMKRSLRAGHQDSLEGLREKLGRAETEKARLAGGLETAEVQKRSLRDRLFESHQFQIGESAFVPRHEALSIDQLEGDVQRLRRQLDKISEVNLAALKEHEELSEKNLFLSGQKDDLLSSQKELGKVISHIDRICEKRFAEILDEVNKRFERVFPVLFEGEGSEARLILLESEDEGGDPGVDILVRPPGKRPLSLAQLSKGEKALASICLIYALFLVKPPPFCIIDEIDAPLDDANALRLISVLNEMSRKSQIITVTHNKRSMQACQKLYGVTMREPGVSQLVSVDLRQPDPQEPAEASAPAG